MFPKSVTAILAPETATSARYKTKQSNGEKNMNERLYKLNKLFIITDMIIAALGVCVFAYSALRFGKWWIAFFALIPLTLYMNHGIILDTQISDAQVEALKPNGGDRDP